MNKLAKNYIYNICYQLLVLVAPLLTAPYLARVLGADLLGDANYVSTVANVFTTVGLLGLQDYSIRQVAYVKEDKTELKKEFYNLLYTRLILGAITVFCYAFLIVFSDMKLLFLLQSFYVVAIFVDPCWFFIGMEDMGYSVARNFMAKLACVIGIFIFVKDQNDLNKYVFLLSFMTLVPSLTVIPLLRKYDIIGKGKLEKPDFSKIKTHIKGSLKLFWPQVATLIYLQTDKLLLKWFDSSSAVAFYDQAEKIVKIPLTFITVLSTVMMPRLANEINSDNKDKMYFYLGSAIRFSSMLAFPMMFGIAGVASILIPWYLGNEFTPVIVVIQMLSPIVILNSLIGVSGNQYLVATNQTKYLTRSYVCAAVLNVAVDLVLVPLIGVKGAAVGTLVAQLTSAVIQYYILLKQMPLLKKELFKSCIYLFDSLPMLAYVVFVGSRLESTWLTTLIQIAGGALIYFLMLLVTRDKMLKRLFGEAKKFLFKSRKKI